ncbi:MAG TPA: phosphatase PAP2 family protein [Xanthomonadaceae bacterium]|nr:phosphatase PAP2 family protein [Xanthomonadaceae bacterium]
MGRGWHAAIERERHLCLVANRWGHRESVLRCFAVASRLGDGAFWYALMAGVVLLDGTAGALAAAHMAATGAAALALYRLLKCHTRRPRPFAGDCRIRPLVRPLDEFSFPSGHTLHAVAFTIVALAHYPGLWPLLVPFAASVGASRVVLGLHYPSDVLAAAGLGCVLGAISLLLAAGLPISIPG